MNYRYVFTILIPSFTLGISLEISDGKTLKPNFELLWTSIGLTGH